MIELKRIELRNYAQHHELDVEFKGNLIAIIGRNGSGKSNFIGAIQFALTGEQPPFNKSDLLSWKQEAGWVKLWFKSNGRDCLIQRRIESAGCTLEVGDEKFTGAKKVAEAMRDVLGLDPDIIKQSVFVRQTQVESCLFTDPRERELNFQRLLGMGDAAKINKQLGDIISGYGQPESFEEAIAEHVAKADEIRSQISEIEAVAKEIADKLAGMDEASVSEEVRELSANLRLVENAVSEGKNVMHWQGVLAQFDKDNPGVTDELPENPEGPILEKIHELSEVIAKCNAAHARNSERASLRMNIAKANEYIGKMRDEESIRADLAEIDSLNQEDAKLKAEEAQAREFLIKAPKGDVCPLCGSKLGEGHSIKAELEERLAKAQQGRADIRKRIAEIGPVGKELDNLKYNVNHRDELERQLVGMGPDDPDGDFDTSEIEEEQGRLRIRLSAERVEYHKAVEKVNELKRIRENCKYAADALANAMKAIPGSENMTPLDLNSIMDDMKADLDAANAKLASIAEVKADKAGIDGQLGQVRKQLADFEGMVERLRNKQKENDVLRDKLAVLNDVREWFNYKNGPRVLTQSVMSALTSSVNSYLDKFGAAFTVQPSEEGMGFLVRFLDGRDMPDQLPDASRLSGGQKIALAVAFRFAVYSIFSNKLGLLSLDEPTAYLDDETIGRFGDLLQRIAQIAKNSSLQILFATHEKSIMSAFDQTIVIGD